MADLAIDFAGIKSPNPFWLASAPPTNSGYQVNRAFEAGWGGAVWKTIGPPVLNVSNRYGAWHYGNQRMLAINNVELISDRPLETNLREIAEVKRNWPDRAVDCFRHGRIAAGGLERYRPQNRGHRSRRD